MFTMDTSNSLGNYPKIVCSLYYPSVCALYVVSHRLAIFPSLIQAHCLRLYQLSPPQTHRHPMTTERKILLTQSQDHTGLIAQITQICYQHGLNIVKNDEFVDREHHQFFMRTELEGVFNDSVLLEELTQALPADTANKLCTATRKRLVLMVTKEPHCLGELLMKSQYGSLNADIVGVIGNHDDLKELTCKFDVPFHCISHNGLSREQQEEEIQNIIAGYNPDYIVLAKYMRILTPSFVEQYCNRIINIHHSFLPAFIGARPYHQAYARGVKIIGATAHFVNNNLDEGPIITQDVTHVDHRYTAEQMAQAGRQVEESVLYHAVQQVTNEKVFVYENRTVVFD